MSEIISPSSIDENDNSSAVQTETKPMVDITDLFRGAASSLSVKDPMLCNDDSFNLQDAMAALEILDAKMDCCEIPASQVAPFGRPITKDENDKERMVFPRPSPIGLDDIIDPLPWNELSIEDAAYISLECLVRLESLLGGASVVESTFTCLYAHQPVVADMKARLDDSSACTLTEQMKRMGVDEHVRTPAQRAVYASVLLLLDLTDVIRGIILNADIFEEEDFTVSTYGISVFENRDENYAIHASKVALESLTKVEGKDDSDAVKAISLMLGFELDLLSICSSMARLSGKQVTKQVELSQKMAKATTSKLEDLSQIVTRLKGNETDKIKALIKKTFDSYVTRPLVGNAPVRKVFFSDAVESLSSLIKMTKELDWALCRTILLGSSLGRIRRMLSRLSTSSVNILIRSLLVLNLYFDDKLFGQHILPDMIIRHMQQLSHIPDEVFQNTASKTFLNRLAKPIYDVLKVMLLNRNRQRAYIEAVMFPDWAALSQEAGIMDITLKKDPRLGPEFPPHFSIYTLYLTIDSMDHYVALAVELNLICGDYELAAAYWYRDFLLSALINQLSTMRKAKSEAKQTQQLHQHAAAAANAKRGKKKGGKNHKKIQTNGSNRVDPEDAEDDFEFLAANLKRVLCRGLVRVSILGSLCRSNITGEVLIVSHNFLFPGILVLCKYKSGRFDSRKDI